MKNKHKTYLIALLISLVSTLGFFTGCNVNEVNDKNVLITNSSGNFIRFFFEDFTFIVYVDNVDREDVEHYNPLDTRSLGFVIFNFSSSVNCKGIYTLRFLQSTYYLCDANNYCMRVNANFDFDNFIRQLITKNVFYSKENLNTIFKEFFNVKPISVDFNSERIDDFLSVVKVNSECLVLIKEHIKDSFCKVYKRCEFYS